MERAAPAVVDVLLPVYNAAPTIESALRSICEQTLRDIRIIVVDDGSTDGTPAILRRLAAEDPRVRVLTTVNRGIVDALNAGLALADAPFIARHDADDIAYPVRLQMQLDHLTTHPQFVAVGCNVVYIDAHGDRTGGASVFVPTVWGDPFYAPAIEPYLIHPFLFVRREGLVAAGGYRYSFHSEDADLYWRLSRFGRLTNLTEVLGEYRLHGASVSSSSILNGRIAAVSSQLAALSEQRRRNGDPDLAFPKSALYAYQAAVDLQPILDRAAVGLSSHEKAFLEVASAAKLIELSNYRPYRMTRRDRKTIRALIARHYRFLSEANRRHMVFRLIPTRQRLSRSIVETIALLPWTVMHVALLELFRFQFRRALGRP